MQHRCFSLPGLMFLAVAFTAAPAAAQGQAAGGALADSGITRTTGIRRVVLFRLADGATMGAVNQDMVTHLIPIWEAQKKAGLIVDYATMTNPTRSSETDWQFGYTITYANWGTLDGFGARANEITLKHYGTAEARTGAGEARDKLRVQVSNHLLSVATYSSAR